MSCVLPSNTFANRAKAGVVIDRIALGMGMNMLASARVLMRHLALLFNFRINTIADLTLFNLMTVDHR